MLENLVDSGDNNTSNKDRNTKKVRFKDVDTDMSSEMAVDFFPVSAMSWRDKVLGTGSSDSLSKEEIEFKYGGDKEETMMALLEKEKMVEASEKFGAWIIVKRKFRRNPRPNGNIFVKIQAKEGGSSRFNALSSLDANEAKNGGIDAIFSGINF
ncbi:hypothetical protein Godav_020954 [Gossypium davidsonii]|uniref:Uncharacterized protein n=1 Tax=Gossypium davidsonii TaxID=34287 RepID=A0A7J8R4L1_GOSDV|nr:hypothetical protein [Gossypium davidsonii]